jgi:hypothetical protein
MAHGNLPIALARSHCCDKAVPTIEEDFSSLCDLFPADWKDPVGYEARRSYLEALSLEAGDAGVELIIAFIECFLRDEPFTHHHPAITDWVDALEDLNRGRLYYAATRRHDGEHIVHDALVYWVGDQITEMVEHCAQAMHECNFRIVEEDAARERAEGR